MSLYYRDYLRDESKRPSGPRNWSVVTRLLLINVLVFVANNLIFSNPNRRIFGLSIDSLTSLYLWTPITYQFLHASLWHLLSNMIGLYFLGNMLLSLVSPRQVVSIYLVGGLAGGAFQLIWNYFTATDPLIIGASASVLAIVFAVVALIPHQRIQLLLFFLIPINLSMRQIGWFILIISGITLFSPTLLSGKEAVAAMAHFGGIAWGWSYIRFGWYKSYRGSRLQVLKNPLGSRRRRRAEPTVSRAASTPASNSSSFASKDIDLILDKINEQGFQSLTDEERAALEQGSRHLAERRKRNR